MRKIIFTFAVLAIAFNSFSQSRDLKKPETKEYYLTKSKAQDRTGWRILIAGYGIIGVSFIIPKGEQISSDMPGSWFNFKRYKNDELKIALLMAGVLTSCISIPFFGHAVKNKKRAAKLGFKMEKTGDLYKPVYAVNSFPALILKLQF